MVWRVIPKEVKLLLCIGGIYFCYIYFGILQEKITKETYSGEKFPSVLFLVLAQCGLAAAVAAASLASGIWFSHTHQHKSEAAAAKQSPASMYSFASLAVSYLGAMMMSSYSLRFVDYSTSVLAKSIKPIPVMLMGVLVNKHRYTFGEYLRILVMTSGVALFMYHPGEARSEQAVHLIGYVLLGFSLLMDGVTGPYQENILRSTSSSALEVMMYTNLFASAYLIVALFLLGEVGEILSFCQRHPQVFTDVLKMGAFSAVGQMIIYYTLANWSSLICSIVTTTRKFLTIVANVVYFGHVLNLRQWSGMMLVFGALFVEFYSKYLPRRATSQNHTKRS